MSAAYAILMSSLILLYACFLWYTETKKEEKHRLYQIERLKIETIILEYQINELAKLMGDNK